MEPKELDKIVDALKVMVKEKPELKQKLNEATMSMMATTAFLFSHPRSEFGIWLMGVAQGIALAKHCGRPRAFMTEDVAMPTLMTLLATFRRDKRHHEMDVDNVDAREQVTIRAEHMLEQFYKDTEDGKEKEG